jgi:hypothetical protein
MKKEEARNLMVLLMSCSTAADGAVGHKPGPDFFGETEPDD